MVDECIELKCKIIFLVNHLFSRTIYSRLVKILSWSPNPSDLKDYETNERSKAGKWGDDARGSATPLKPSSLRRKLEDLLTVILQNYFKAGFKVASLTLVDSDSSLLNLHLSSTKRESWQYNFARNENFFIIYIYYIILYCKLY